MNISLNELLAQYRRAVAALPFVHDVERQYKLPPYTLFAVGSREVDWDMDYTRGKVGDNGYGHGPWQLDNHPQNASPQRDADCARIDAGDMPFAAEKAAQELADDIARCPTFAGALAAYNSGSCNDSRTTGHDYGADTSERQRALLGALGPPVPPRRREDDEP